MHANITRAFPVRRADSMFRSASDQGADEAVVTAALKRAFLSLEREMLNQFDADQAGDGCTALVCVRIGGTPKTFAL